MERPPIYYTDSQGHHDLAPTPQGEEPITQPDAPRTRPSVPPLTYPTSTQRHLQQTLQTAARLIFAYDQSAQVGWLLFLLESLEGLYKVEHWPQVKGVFESLRTELAERLQAATW